MRALASRPAIAPARSATPQIHESLMRSELDAPADAAVAALAERLRHDVAVVTPAPTPKPPGSLLAVAPSASREPHARSAPDAIGRRCAALAAIAVSSPSS